MFRYKGLELTKLTSKQIPIFAIHRDGRPGLSPLIFGLQETKIHLKLAVMAIPLFGKDGKFSFFLFSATTHFPCVLGVLVTEISTKIPSKI